MAKLSTRISLLAVPLAAMVVFGCREAHSWTPSAPTATAPAVLAPDALGRQTFDEDFATFDHGVDQDQPSTPHRWRTVYGIGGPKDPNNRTLVGNGEDEIYMDPAFGGLTGCKPLGVDPFDFKPGVLDIKIERLADPAKTCLGRGWSSGVITTRWSFAQKWGYYEADIDVPVQRGLWPAFWLMPTGGAWPDGGEVDVLESVGPATPGGTPLVSINAIWKSPKDGSRADHQDYTVPITPGFHRYGVLWRPDTISFYFDRKLLRTSPTPPGYVYPMYMILNVGVGLEKSWPGRPDPDLQRADMRVRRVSVWELKNPPPK